MHTVDSRRRLATLSILALLFGASCRIAPPDDTGGGDTGDTDLPIEETLTVAGVYGSVRAQIWPTGSAQSGTLERRLGSSGAWTTIASGDGPWADDDPQEDAVYRLRTADAQGPAVALESLALSLATTRTDSLFYRGEPIVLEQAAMLSALAADARVEITRTVDGETDWLGETCRTLGGAGCWSDSPETLLLSSLPATFPDIPADATAPVFVTLSAEVLLADVVLHTETMQYVELGRAVAWGDVHAHSNLSNDGCEDREQDCAERGASAAEDFFQQAIDRSLDFAAITDHAEWLTYTPAGEGAVDIWSAQQAAAQNAEGSSTVPILGYEWTDYGGHLNNATDGGHKTVLLSTLDACPAYRIGASYKTEPDIKPLETGIFDGGNAFVGGTPTLLWSALDAAAVACPGVRALTFFHHSAFDTPQSVLWQDSGNTPSPRYETVVEIYSEHGASECADPKARDCDWRGKSNTAYVSDGGVQTSLQRGHRLGFVAGTDSHDSRPGSVEDAPSCTANTLNGEFLCHDHTGGLTGVLYEGSLDRDAIFDAVAVRSTLATSKPRLPVRAVLLGADGVPYLPGSLVPALTARTARLLVSLEGLVDETLYSGVTIEVLAADNRLLDSTDSDILDIDIVVSINEPFYVRVRLHNDGDGERIWLSPFFGI